MSTQTEYSADYRALTTADQELLSLLIKHPGSEPLTPALKDLVNRLTAINPNGQWTISHNYSQPRPGKWIHGLVARDGVAVQINEKLVFSAHDDPPVRQRAVWFSRHTPTAEQLADIDKLGFDLVRIPEGQALGGRAINSEEDLTGLVLDLEALVGGARARAVFGVVPSPLQGYLAKTGEDDYRVPFYASWNVARSIEGEKPTFAHFKWVKVGDI
jgi:hypothetical protein